MRLALGTVQFGLAYGVAGRGDAVPEAEARAILARAHALGIRTLDTASAYGNIEEHLADLCDDLDFDIVSKIPPLPQNIAPAEAAHWTLEQAERSRMRLGQRLRHLMLHRADDLLKPGGSILWSALAEWSASTNVGIGASCYEPSTVISLKALPKFGIAQIPGNALDQRIGREWSAPPACEVHLRSAFLQGLLLMPQAAAARLVPAATDALAAWHRWCRQQDLEPLIAALSIVKSFAAVSVCVVGVDRIEHLEQTVVAWHRASAVAAPQLHCENPAVIDPRRWSTA